MAGWALPGLVASADFGSALFVLLVTVCGFVVPMLLVYPPVAPRESDFLQETHRRLGLDTSQTNLKSRSSVGRRRASQPPPQPQRPSKIQSIWIYPVKSCRGIEVARTRVYPTGLEFDRLFTFAQLKSPFPLGLAASDEEQSRHRWEFVTQRQFPLLATLDVELWQPDLAKSRRKPSAVAESFLVLRYPWQDDGVRGALSWVAAKLTHGLAARPRREVVVPLDFPSKRDIEERGYTYDDVTVWRDSLTALNMESCLPPELRLYLGVSNKLALFRIDPDKQLREIYRCAPSRDEAGYQPVTGFQDAYPLHLINISSVQDLESKMPKDGNLQELDARRFRANIITTGAPAYDEDSWKAIRVKPSSASSGLEESTFHVSCRTVRCKMPNVHQSTGERHPAEPDRSLREHRSVDEGAPGSGCLGMQLTPLFANTERPEDLATVLEVGMSIDVLERGAHRYIRI